LEKGSFGKLGENKVNVRWEIASSVKIWERLRSRMRRYTGLVDVWKD